MKIITYNVNGLRAAVSKGLPEWLAQENPDILCLQETGIMAASKPILGVLESGSEVRCLIEDTHGGLCCEPGEYDKVEENLRWFIDNAGSEELKAMGARGRENLEKNLTRNVSVRKYTEEILKL